MPDAQRGRILVVGLGPGDAALLPPLARQALASSTLIAGYSPYVALVPQELRAGRTLVATGMTAETARCEAALDAALAGEKVAVVCSGDPGVYAMAGLVLELMRGRGLTLADVDCAVIPGIPAVCAAAALLGAPLMHDFACVSLSDLLTPWALIEKRLTAALDGDFVLALYNPRSKGRDWQLEKALELARARRTPQTPVGLVRNAFRAEQSVSISELALFPAKAVDMLSLVVVGNSASAVLPAPGGAPDWSGGARMYTPRGYAQKYHAVFGS
jgi:precorrin-3B C17-methyltransferase